MSDDLARLLREAVDGLPARPRRYEDVMMRRARLQRLRRVQVGIAGCVIAASLTALAAPFRPDVPRDALVSTTSLPAAPSDPASEPKGGAEATTSASACPVVAAQHLPADFTSSALAYVCSVQVRQFTGDGTWTVDVVRRVSGGLDRLLSTYAVPDISAAPPDGAACTSIAVDPLQVWLHVEDHVTVVRAPTGPCRFPTSEAQNAYEALDTVVVRETKRSQISTEQADTTGCYDQYKVIDEPGADPDGPPGSPGPVTPVVADASVCVYNLAAPDGGERIGKLVSSKRLTLDADVERLNRLLAELQPAPRCPVGGFERFALIGVFPGGPEPLFVELDGCQVRQGSRLWRGNDLLRAFLQ